MPRFRPQRDAFIQLFTTEPDRKTVWKLPTGKLRDPRFFLEDGTPLIFYVVSVPQIGWARLDDFDLFVAGFVTGNWDGVLTGLPTCKARYRVEREYWEHIFKTNAVALISKALEDKDTSWRTAEVLVPIQNAELRKKLRLPSNVTPFFFRRTGVCEQFLSLFSE